MIMTMMMITMMMINMMTMTMTMTMTTKTLIVHAIAFVLLVSQLRVFPLNPVAAQRIYGRNEPLGNKPLILLVSFVVEFDLPTHQGNENFQRAVLVNVGRESRTVLSSNHPM